MVSLKSYGFIKLILKPPSPSLYFGFFLSCSSFLTNTWYSSLFMVEEPSSATLLAAPGSSISRSISYPLIYSVVYAIERPSFLTFSALSCSAFFAYMSDYLPYLKFYCIKLWSLFFDFPFFFVFFDSI